MIWIGTGGIFQRQREKERERVRENREIDARLVA
jgi:hypothetical protein